jgi:cellulose synthase/poly-beta-1,6-N-acetylglucosamine synthase-like glycosyltransferase
MIILVITILLFVLYSILILYYWQSWKAIPEFSAQSKTSAVSISIIIPARNEEENIRCLLTAIQKQTFPGNLFEIIVINDHSTDNTSEIVKEFSEVILIELKEAALNSYKKKAIETGVAAASNELIVTTDADCIPPATWLETIALFKEQNDSVFIAAPVVFDLQKENFLSIFQTLDFMILQGITGASVHTKIHSMCNGANLAYEKKAFKEVNGFEGIDQLASGDDMLLMHKIAKKNPGKVHYLRSTAAIVSTQPMKTWKDLFNQRIRWASKATYYDDKRIIGVLLLVYLFNLSFLVLLVAGFWSPAFWLYLFIFWVAKTIVEFPFVYSVARFFDRQSLLKYFFFFQPFHIFYTIIAGWLGQSGKYEWKGRRVR